MPFVKLTFAFIKIVLSVIFPLVYTDSKAFDGKYFISFKNMSVVLVSVHL